MLCVSIRPDTIEALKLQYAQAKKEAALVEIRLDGFSEIPFQELQALSGCILCLGTAFSKKKYTQELYYTLASLNPEWLDISVDEPQELFTTIFRQFPSVKVIASYHNLEKTPEDLYTVWNTVQQLPCHTIKIATFANSSVDALRMLVFVKDVSKQRHVVALCMGEKGVFSRVLGPIFGSSIVYSSLAGESIAPGQLSCDELRDVYNMEGATKKRVPFGLIGATTVHSRSHILHNALYRRLDRDAVYVKMCVEQGEFSEAFCLIRQLGFGGLSVTTPLKNSFDPYVPYNTVVFTDSEYTLHNTDGRGMVDAIEKRTPIDGKRVIIIGAGGTARAIAQEAHNRDAEVIICNRTVQTAETIAQKIGCQAASLDTIDALLAGGYDILINATTSGLGGVSCLLMKEEWFMSGAVVADVVNEDATPFLEMAKKRGCSIVSGKDMWIEQAQGQLALWFGERPNIQTLLVGV